MDTSNKNFDLPLLEDEQIDAEAPAEPEKKPRRNRSERTYTEDAIQLKIAAFRGLLSGKRRRGNFVIDGNEKSVGIYYTVDLDSETPKLQLYYNHNSQTVMTARQKLANGEMFRFICECGRACNILYLPPRTRERNFIKFRCRYCCGLDYSVCYINKRTQHGKYFYFVNRWFRISDKLSECRRGRLFYKGKLIKRIQKISDEYGKYRIQPPSVLVDLLETRLLIAMGETAKPSKDKAI